MFIMLCICVEIFTHYLGTWYFVSISDLLDIVNYRYYFEIILCLKCSFFSWYRPQRIFLELWALGLLQACTYWRNSSRVQFAALFSFIFVPKLIHSHAFKRHLHADDSKIHIHHPDISPELQVLSTSLLVCLLGISESELLIPPPPPLHITSLFFCQWQHKKKSFVSG